MTTMHHEVDLWQKVCKGDVEAFNTLFRAQYKSLCIGALVLLKDQERAEDVVQDVFLKVWAKREELGNITNISGYLYTSVKNACLDELRKLKFTDDIVELEISDDAADPFHSVRLKELNQQLQFASQGLPAQCREIFERVYLEGKKYQEVADELGVSINTVKTQLKRALAKMRHVMEKYR
ncbi:RNA polymerase sigma-70 factor [Pedobacter nanyangensis]|uniref:RNA polymerase sigma-70 factor n=1 Tax=Pedobacter nanyangensis TaxID=1562389 RepID=UPI000DE3F311|nr:RNA polymerase sigma-70 factor [Pedobacter nanyangensis]